ncbi:MAG TPA: VOC family protein [Burkholderiaceae bacterium]|nr:VOC family protein [Burkholderiaceae bacterium]
MRYEKLGYVALNVSDVERSRLFYEQVVGLQYCGSNEQGHAFLRCSLDHHNIVLCPSKQPGLKRIGVEMQDDAALDELARKLDAHAIRWYEVPAEESAAWHQRRTLRMTDPFTHSVFEFYGSMRLFGGQPYAPTVAKIQRIGHVVTKTPRFAEACAFYTDVLEFKVSDQIGDAVCFMRFHPNPYHHGIGVARGAAPLLHHVNFMVTEVDDIGKAIARFGREKVTIVNGPGRHPASGSMFLYFLDPDGMTLEYSFGMEEFPAEGARKPRVFEPIPESYDYWRSFSDPRKATVGDIERDPRS